ncbi:hypothetical protein BBJ28_00006757 [Nothophytophthora sp. Chile5]|nr:hypothetical protein BBJ28_00006757 [Nothophytophthora sp. Chile5]
MFMFLALLLFSLSLSLFITAEADFLHAFEGTMTLPPPTSVLHPNTPAQAPLNPDVAFTIQTTNTPFSEYVESFPQHGKVEPGQHYRIENSPLLAQVENKESDSVLIIIVFNDTESWGANRSSTDFFQLVNSFNYPKAKISIAMLTSSIDEFTKVKKLFNRYVHDYAQLSVIFRNDFTLDDLTRDNRHDDPRQAGRRRMIARYRNYALLSTLETWHQHVLWLDADINVIPAGLLSKMAQLPLDSVGGSVLYVRADVHRQGVLFPPHYVIGSEWEAEGYDGIETEGLCYIAHFLGFKCWGMPNDLIFHVP